MCGTETGSSSSNCAQTEPSWLEIVTFFLEVAAPSRHARATSGQGLNCSLTTARPARGSGSFNKSVSLIGSRLRFASPTSYSLAYAWNAASLQAFASDDQA